MEGDIYFKYICHCYKNSFQIVVSVLYGLLHCSFLFLKFLKLPSLYETFRDSRCYIWCCKKGQDRMIGLTSSGQLATTSMDNFPCLLIFNFKHTALFCNIFDTEVN